MIVDKIANAFRYYSVNPGFEKVFKYLQEEHFVNITPGKYKINGSEAEVTVQEYSTKNPEEVEWESHKFHLDVQYLIRGVERIGYAPTDGMEIKEYNAASDKLILDGTDGDFITLKEDLFVVMFPEDAHQPRVAAGELMPVKKVIIKILA